MKIVAKRPFISSKPGLGNVRAGLIVETDDGYAQSLIKAGLAEEYSPARALRAPEQPSFTSPVGENAGNGSLSPADRVSQKQTATKSRHGAKKTKNAG